MAYLETAEELPELVSLGLDNGSRSGLYRRVNLTDHRGERLTHEKFLDELLKGPLSVDEMKKRFPGVSYALEEIMDYQVEAGYAEKYNKDNRTMYKLTKEGREWRKFWLRWNKPELYRSLFKR